MIVTPGSSCCSFFSTHGMPVTSAVNRFASQCSVMSDGVPMPLNSDAAKTSLGDNNPNSNNETSGGTNSCNSNGGSMAMTSDEFASLFTSCSSEMLLLDVRGFMAFNRGHLRSSINVNMSESLAKRPGFSLKTVESNICTVDKSRFREREGLNVILYDSNGLRSHNPASHLMKIAQKLQDEAKVKHVHILKDGFDGLARLYPQFITTEKRPVIQIRSFPKISSSSPSSTSPSIVLISTTPKASGLSVDCPIASRLQLSEDQSALSLAPLVQVLDDLYLGDDVAAADAESLLASGITHIVNTATECENHMANDSRFVYKRMDLVDNPDQQCLVGLFESVCCFIDEARQNHHAVLVHCRAGRSRSATVILAYLMTRLNWSLTAAYDFLKAKRPNMCPNLGFMGMLLRYTGPPKSTQSSTPSCKEENV